MYGLPVRYRLLLYVTAAGVLLTIAVASSRVVGSSRKAPCPPGSAQAADNACAELTADVDGDGRPDAVIVYLNGPGQLCAVTILASGRRGVQSEPAFCRPLPSGADKP